MPKLICGKSAVGEKINSTRYTIGEEIDSLTDFEWYFSRIIKVLHEEKSLSVSYKIEDFIG